MRQISRQQARPLRASSRPGTCQAARLRRAPVTRAAAAAAPGGGLSGLSFLTDTRPVDRLRFQAILVFKHFDADDDGKITLAQLDEYEAYSAERFGPVAAAQLKPLYANLRTAAAQAGEATVDMETFIDLIRGQVKFASASRDFPRFVMPEAELGRLGWSTSLSPADLSSALAIFRLLDFNADSYVRLEDLRKAQGLEREIVADQLEDADTNEDGFLSFKDFLTSYARERPVLLNAVVLLAHSAAFWFILNLPMLELPFRALLCVALMLKPQVVTGPVIKLFTVLRTLWNRGRAEIEMARMRPEGGAA